MFRKSQRPSKSPSLVAATDSSAATQYPGTLSSWSLDRPPDSLPRPLAAQQLLRLQGTVGNHAARKVAPVSPGTIQRNGPEKALTATAANMPGFSPDEQTLTHHHLSRLQPSERQTLGNELAQVNHANPVIQDNQRAERLWGLVLEAKLKEAMNTTGQIPNLLAYLREYLNSPGLFLTAREEIIKEFRKAGQSRREFFEEQQVVGPPSNRVTVLKNAELAFNEWTGALKCRVASQIIGRMLYRHPGLHLQPALWYGQSGGGLTGQDHWHVRLNLDGQEILIDGTWKQFFVKSDRYRQLSPVDQEKFKRIIFDTTRFPRVFVGNAHDLRLLINRLEIALLQAGLDSMYMPREEVRTVFNNFWFLAGKSGVPIL